MVFELKSSSQSIVHRLWIGIGLKYLKSQPWSKTCFTIVVHTIWLKIASPYTCKLSFMFDHNRFSLHTIYAQPSTRAAKVHRFSNNFRLAMQCARLQVTDTTPRLPSCQSVQIFTYAKHCFFCVPTYIYQNIPTVRLSFAVDISAFRTQSSSTFRLLPFFHFHCKLLKWRRDRRKHVFLIYLPNFCCTQIYIAFFHLGTPTDAVSKFCANKGEVKRERRKVN